jgi:dUTPase
MLTPMSRSYRKTEVPIGISVGLPTGTYGRIAPRSELAVRYAIDVYAGVIDPNYAGEVIGALQNHGDATTNQGWRAICAAHRREM